MRAQQLQGLEGPSGLHLVEVDEPEDMTRVVIEVAAAGVSFPDLLLTRGEYQMKPPLPFVPGVEVAGRVRSAPEGSGFVAGDRVMAFTVLGGFADVALAEPALTLAIPDGLSVEVGVGIHHELPHRVFRIGTQRPDPARRSDRHPRRRWRRRHGRHPGGEGNRR